ncbi:MAG: PAS domain-containing protein [Chlorobiales bacterium]|nr:PAS domain-containing protein [Chlorobiales bacterium]
MDSILSLLTPLVKALADTFGSRCEVVLHDLRHLDRSVVKIENGHVTGRKDGSSVLDGRWGDKGLKLLKSGTKEDALVNYSSQSSDGKPLKSTTVLFRDRKGEAVAALCINFDLSDLMGAGQVLGELCLTGKTNDIDETHSEDIVYAIRAMIDNEVEKYPCSVAAMKKQDRVAIVSRLYEQGVFGAKGAVKDVAKKLHVTKYTIYSYLEEIKS